MTRPTLDEYYLALARVVATRSTCLRRSVGCVLVNERGQVISTGYNGVARSVPHCNEHTGFIDEKGQAWKPYSTEWDDYPRSKVRDRLIYGNACDGAADASGTNLDACEAVHAEQNAMISVGDAWSIETCYVTASPCVSCVKLLLNSSCRRIIYLDEYPQPTARMLWVSTNREWLQCDSKYT